MKKWLVILFILWIPLPALADLPAIELEAAPIKRGDVESIKRGAKVFAGTCMACHTLKYLRYDKLARRAGVTYEKMPINVKWPQGSVPPDLSLEADARGVDWIYTYLHSFYLDPSRPTGFNNLLVPNTMMPDMVMSLQGPQALSSDYRLSRTLNHEWRWYDLLVLQQQGRMSPQEFDATIADLVNFLDYAAEPYYMESVHIGARVLAYLLVLFILMYLLKREYWKDVKKK